MCRVWITRTVAFTCGQVRALHAVEGIRQLTDYNAVHAEFRIYIFILYELGYRIAGIYVNASENNKFIGASIDEGVEGSVSGHVADDDAWRHEGPLAEI